MVGTVCVMCVMRKFGHPVCPCLRFWSTCCCLVGEFFFRVVFKFFFRAAISPIVNTCASVHSPFLQHVQHVARGAVGTAVQCGRV